MVRILTRKSYEGVGAVKPLHPLWRIYAMLDMTSMLLWPDCSSPLNIIKPHNTKNRPVVAWMNLTAFGIAALIWEEPESLSSLYELEIED